MTQGAAIDLLAICQKEDHLLSEQGWSHVTETPERKERIRRVYCNLCQWRNKMQLTTSFNTYSAEGSGFINRGM